MKTYYLFSRRLSLFSFLGLLAIMVTSCGSYQNSSYYDGDGVYGNGENKKRETASNDNSQSDKYQEYFSDLNKESEVFTNVDSYSSVNNDSVATNTQTYNDNNSSWGSNPQSVTVNVYDNNWGYGYWNNYWGWNSWYGPGWGWGWNNWYGPGWGWGWNNWYGAGWNVGWGGWYSPWYGGYYNNYYHYHNGGRRGSSFGYTSNRVNSPRSGYSMRNSNNVVGGRRNNAIGTRSTTFNPTRNNSGFNPTRNNSVRNNTNANSSPRPNTNSSQPRGNVRTESSPARSYTPSSSNYGGGRSSSGGGGGGGSYGGGRSSSGGGGRR